MTKGWHIELAGEGGKVEVFKVAIPDRAKAIAAVIQGGKSTSVTATPLSDLQYESLALAPGKS